MPVASTAKAASSRCNGTINPAEPWLMRRRLMTQEYSSDMPMITITMADSDNASAHPASA